MRKLLLLSLINLIIMPVIAQTTNLAPGDYKSIVINNSGYGDYTRKLILLHEMYNDTFIGMNYSVGTIAAFRGSVGSFNRINIVELNTSSAYGSTSASIRSLDHDDILEHWKLKTCIYNNKKYLAVEIPYTHAHHDNGYKFVGWTASTSDNMIMLEYQLHGQSINNHILSDIQDFVPNINETYHTNKFVVFGDVGIGIANPTEKLSVNGKIRAKEIKVEAINWPDYVFGADYKLQSLEEIENFIKTKNHLPGIPSAAEVEKEGVSLGEMNNKLLKKIEELTLHLINMKKELDELKTKIK